MPLAEVIHDLWLEPMHALHRQYEQMQESSDQIVSASGLFVLMVGGCQGRA